MSVGTFLSDVLDVRLYKKILGIEIGKIKWGSIWQYAKKTDPAQLFKKKAIYTVAIQQKMCYNTKPSYNDNMTKKKWWGAFRYMPCTLPLHKDLW